VRGGVSTQTCHFFYHEKKFLRSGRRIVRSEKSWISDKVYHKTVGRREVLICRRTRRGSIATNIECHVMDRVFVVSPPRRRVCLFAPSLPVFPFRGSFSFFSPSPPLLLSLSPPFIPPLVLPALLLRVPSFPREPLRCPPILAWIRTGGPGTSTVSMPKSWLWAIAVSLSYISFPQTTVSYDLSPSTRRGQDQPPTTIHPTQIRPQEHHIHYRCFFCSKESYREWRQGSSPALGHCWPGALP
jgi:hypothetical protein